MENKVGIITRTKNRNILLKRAIEGIIAQTYKNWEMVIVNDGGDKENVEELVDKYKEYHSQIKLIHNENSLGMEAASNVGIKACLSEYIVIHDDDDSWKPEFLEVVIKEFNTNKLKSCKGIITYSERYIEEIINEKVKIISKEPYNVWLKNISLYRLTANNVFPPISFVYKREVFEEIGYYREDLPVLGDWEFNLRFIEKYDIFLIPKLLANYHHRLETKSGSYSNSVISGVDKHEFYDNYLRNEFLRKDLERGHLGIGYLVNISKSFETLHSQISLFERLIFLMKKNKFLKKVAKKIL